MVPTEDHGVWFGCCWKSSSRSSRASLVYVLIRHREHSGWFLQKIMGFGLAVAESLLSSRSSHARLVYVLIRHREHCGRFLWKIMGFDLAVTESLLSSRSSHTRLECVLIVTTFGGVGGYDSRWFPWTIWGLVFSCRRVFFWLVTREVGGRVDGDKEKGSHCPERTPPDFVDAMTSTGSSLIDQSSTSPGSCLRDVSSSFLS